MKNLISLIGNKVLIILILSIPLGLIVGFIEILFAVGFNDVLISSKIIDGDIKINIILNSFIVLILIALFRFFFVYISQFNTNLIFELINQKVRELVILKNYNINDSISISKSQSFLNNVSTKLAEFLNSISEIFIQSLTFIIVYIYLLFSSPTLTIYSSFIFLAVGAPLLFMKKKISLYSNYFQSNVNLIIEKITKDLRNLLFFKIIGSLEKEKNQILNDNKISINPYLKYISRLTFLNQLPNFLGIVLIITIIYINRINNYVTIDLLVPYLYLTLRSIIAFGHILHNSGRALFCVPYVKTFLTIKINDKNLSSKDLKEKINIHNIILDVKNLSIGYENIIKKDISFKIKEGDFCLFKGPSGSGKTALIMTLIGLLNKKTGTIKWDGHDIEKVNLSDLRQKIFYCGTDPYLIEGTVYENLIYGLKNDNLEMSEIENVLNLTNCNFLKIDNRYNLKLKLDNEGSGLSAGQKQRISIARSLINSPRILILDEATVNIDEQNEFEIIRNIKKTLPYCTILAVSHRKSIEKFSNIKIDLN
jgi:ABC-type multidrug transport system fused ATPase/permease subunit